MFDSFLSFLNNIYSNSLIDLNLHVRLKLISIGVAMEVGTGYVNLLWLSKVCEFLIKPYFCLKKHKTTVKLLGEIK